MLNTPFSLNPASTSIALLVGLAVYFILRRRSSAIRDIAGPPSPSWIFGHMLQLLLATQYGDHEFKWLKTYGPVYRLKGWFGQDRLMVSDPVALQFVLNSPHIVNSPLLQNMINMLGGEGSVFSFNGAYHRRLRAGLKVGFTATAVRGYQPVFEKAAQMLSDRLEKSSAPLTNMCPLLGSFALSVIGEVLLGYSAEDLGPEFVALNTEIMALASSPSRARILADGIVPWLPGWLLGAVTYLPTRMFATLRRANYLAVQIAERSIRDKLNAATEGREMGADIFSHLVNQGRSENTKSAGLSDKEAVSQTSMFLLAGQNNPANTMAFGLIELARRPQLQNQLRTEIHSAFSAGTQVVGYDDLPLLNAFIKELLRFYPAEPLTERMAIQDTVLPLAESITTSTGEHITSIPIRKGQILTVAIASYQRFGSQWGDDLHEFRPSRWMEEKRQQKEGLGAVAGLLAFLGGNHTCLGWRLALLEIQVLICELISKFSFALPENNVVLTRLANTLLPANRSGEKAALFRITRVPEDPKN